MFNCGLINVFVKYTFPIDSAVTAIHITIKASFYIKAELTSPGGNIN